jgi:hypothetical protein
MPLRKYRSVEEMPAPEPRPPLDPDNLRIAFAWMKLACELRPLRRTPGVRKLSSLDERRQG